MGAGAGWRVGGLIRTPECRETESGAALRRTPEPPASVTHQQGTGNATKSNHFPLNVQRRKKGRGSGNPRRLIYSEVDLLGCKTARCFTAL